MAHLLSNQIKIILSISFIIGLSGLKWGLPTTERSSFYSIKNIEDLSNNKIYRLSPLESFHPDEGLILNALSNMNPSSFDFDPKYYNYPSLHIYLTGFILKLGQIAKIFTVNNDKNYYLKNPNEIGKIYYLGRLLSTVMAAVTVILLFNISNNLFDNRTALISSLMLTFSPLWVRNIHFMQVNVPVTFWITLTIYFLTISLKKKSNKFLILSSIASGLAFSTKYTALPFIFLPILFSIIKRKINYFLFILILIPLVTFFITSPYVIISFYETINDLIFESNDKISQPSFKYFIESIIMAYGPLTTILILIGFVFSLKNIKNIEKQILIFWLLSTSVVVIISGDSKLIRYLIPVLPCLCIYAALAIRRIWVYFEILLKSKFLTYTIVFSLFIPSVLYSTNIIRIFMKNDIRIEAADWIEKNVVNKEIGLINEIYFDLPTINSDFYNITSIQSLNPSDWPKTLIFSSSPSSEYFIARLPNTYSLKKVFNQKSNPIFTYPFQLFFEDWQYTFLDIYVYQK